MSTFAPALRPISRVIHAGLHLELRDRVQRGKWRCQVRAQSRTLKFSDKLLASIPSNWKLLAVVFAPFTETFWVFFPKCAGVRNLHDRAR